ncbi:MAG: hypothetical protein WA667_17990, partial [Candidatus Nitrosopolaris sp.]
MYVDVFPDIPSNIWVAKLGQICFSYHRTRYDVGPTTIKGEIVKSVNRNKIRYMGFVSIFDKIPSDEGEVSSKIEEVSR